MSTYTFIHKTYAKLTLLADSEELAVKEFEDLVLEPSDWYLDVDDYSNWAIE